jgi:hypothetical protein
MNIEMKSELEIKAEINTLKSMLDYNKGNEKEAEKLRSLIVALQWVLGYQSDIFN